MRPAPAILGLTLLLQAVPGLAAQDEALPVGEIPHLDSIKISRLRQALDARDWEAALRLYYGASLRSDLTDAIVYLRRDSTVHQALVHSGKEITDRIMRSRQFLYVLVLSDNGVKWTGSPELNVGSCAMGGSSTGAQTSVRGTTTESTITGDVLADTIETSMGKGVVRTRTVHDSSGPLSGSTRTIFRRVTTSDVAPAAGPTRLLIRRSHVAYQSDPFIVRLVNAVGSKLFGGASTKQADGEPRDSAAVVTLARLGSDSQGSICHATAKFPLGTNVDGRIAVEAGDGFDLPSGRRTVLNFVNSSASVFSAGLSLGFTHGQIRKAKVDTTARFTITTTDTVTGTVTTRDSIETKASLKKRGVNLRANAFILVGVALRRPALPHYGTGVDLIFGTNLPTGTIFDEWIVGVALTRVIHDVGIVGGCNLLLEDTKDGERRRCHPYLGFDFRL